MNGRHSGRRKGEPLAAIVATCAVSMAAMVRSEIPCRKLLCPAAPPFKKLLDAG
jgi:hypothetical protein